MLPDPKTFATEWIESKSIESIAIYYKSVIGKMAIEVMFFDADGKVSKVIAHYN